MMLQPGQQGCLLLWCLIVFSSTIYLLSWCLLCADVITLKPELILVLRFELSKKKILYLQPPYFYDTNEINYKGCQDRLMAYKTTHILQKRPHFFGWPLLIHEQNKAETRHDVCRMLKIKDFASDLVTSHAKR